MGDASANHSTATGALNTAAYCAYQRLPLPLLVVCEDNGIGISVRTPPGWVAAAASGRTGLRYFHADGSDLRDIPGLIIASPARPDDAAAMLRTCLAAAEADGSVCAFLEPIALYHARDLLAAGDGAGRSATTRRSGGRPGMCRSAGPAPTVTAPR